MERLIADANKWAEENGKAADLSIDSFSDVVTAIDYIQQKQGIAGTTAKEAATTIEGSLNMTKAAWENLVTALSDPDADIESAMDNLITAIVGEGEGEGLLNQLIPAVQRAVEGIGQFIQAAVPMIAEKLPDLIQTFLPVITQSAITLVTSLVSALPSIISTLIQMIPQLISMIITGLDQGLAPLAEEGRKLINSLLDAIKNGIISAASALVGFAKRIPNAIKSGLGSLASAGRDLISGLWNGIKSKFDSVISRVKALASQLPKAVKKVLGISSPSKVFMELGKWIPEGLALGIEKNMGVVEDASDAMADATLFSPAEGYTEGAGTVTSSNVFNIYATPNQSAREIAEEVRKLIIKDENQRRYAWV